MSAASVTPQPAFDGARTTARDTSASYNDNNDDGKNNTDNRDLKEDTTAKEEGAPNGSAKGGSAKEGATAKGTAWLPADVRRAALSWLADDVVLHAAATAALHARARALGITSPPPVSTAEDHAATAVDVDVAASFV